MIAPIAMLARRVSVVVLAFACAVASVFAADAPTPYDRRPDTRAFIDFLAAEDGFDRQELTQLFAQARYLPKVVTAMSRPVLAPPKWYDYAPQFLNPERIDAGLDFWRVNAATLARAQAEFGVPSEVIVAIIGVETYYGRHVGSYRVFDALTTLAFDYPRRADFFRGELEQFLLLTRAAGISPLSPMGSYAGASGLPQFMPGSARAYALDYDHDGRIDLSGDPADAIGSVANFLSRHDWQRGGPVLLAARVDPVARDIVARAKDGGISERRLLEAWARDGVTADSLPANPGSDAVGLLMLEEADGPSYWLTFGNWYVLTRYNRSRLYATAVWQLAQALSTARATAARLDGVDFPVAPALAPAAAAPAAATLPPNAAD